VKKWYKENDLRNLAERNTALKLKQVPGGSPRRQKEF
jgi:hypothetical protein